MAVQMLDHMIERLASSSFRRRWLTVWVWVIILLGAWARHRRSREILLTADGCVVPTLMLRIITSPSRRGTPGRSRRFSWSSRLPWDPQRVAP